MKNYSTIGFRDLPLKDITNIGKKEIQKLSGSVVLNNSKKIKILINRNTTKHAGKKSITSKKICILKDLLYVLRNCEYDGLGEPKDSHFKKFPTIICFVRFKYRCRIDGVINDFRLSVVLDSKGHFHYSLSEA